MAKWEYEKINGMGYREYAVNLADQGLNAAERAEMLERKFTRLSLYVAKGLTSDSTIAKYQQQFQVKRQNNDADWKKHQATGSQIGYLKSLGATDIPNNLTKGAASKWINELKSSKKSGRLGYGEDEGDFVDWKSPRKVDQPSNFSTEIY